MNVKLSKVQCKAKFTSAMAMQRTDRHLTREQATSQITLPIVLLQLDNWDISVMLL